MSQQSKPLNLTFFFFFRDLDVYFLDGRHTVLVGDFNCFRHAS